LLSYVREIDFLEVKAVCEDALEANKVLGSTPVDLMFLDIQMPKITGIEFLSPSPHRHGDHDHRLP